MSITSSQLDRSGFLKSGHLGMHQKPYLGHGNLLGLKSKFKKIVGLFF